MGEVFKFMQAKEWSPNGEAKELIIQNGLKHTSMSVGDVIQHGSKFFECDLVGWKEII